ncbi:MAG: hypothetical protein WBC44_18310 [Planctomycetaceae bacterium]
MTLSPAPRPDDPTATSRCEADLVDAARSTAAPPDGAITLADLVADAGPLPPDAALECVQRLAELLSRLPAVSRHSLDATHVLIDDDGCVWLRDSPDSEPGTATPLANESADGPQPATIDGMNRIGRLLVCLVSGDLRHQSDGPALEAATLPAPLAMVAARLFSRNGSCYSTYAELATDAAAVRGVGSQTAAASTVRESQPAKPPAKAPTEPLTTTGSRPATESTAQASRLENDASPDAADDETTHRIGVIALIVLVLAAVAVVALWQWL